MNIRIVPPKRQDATQLRKVAKASKGHWNYLDDWLALWRDKPYVTTEFITANQVRAAFAKDTLLGFAAISPAGRTACIENM